MEMTIIDKLTLIFKYIISSFMGIELFILSLILFLFTFLNIKKNNKIVKIISALLCIGFLVGIVVTYKSYAIQRIVFGLGVIFGIIYFIKLFIFSIYGSIFLYNFICNSRYNYNYIFK